MNLEVLKEKLFGACIVDVQQADATHLRLVLDTRASVEIDAAGLIFPGAAKLLVDVIEAQ